MTRNEIKAYVKDLTLKQLATVWIWWFVDRKKLKAFTAAMQSGCSAAGAYLNAKKHEQTRVKD